MAKRHGFSARFKAQVAIEALCGERTVPKIAARLQAHRKVVSTWKRQAVEGMADAFGRGGTAEGPTEAEMKEPHAKIGRLAVENDGVSQGRRRSPLSGRKRGSATAIPSRASASRVIPDLPPESSLAVA